MFTCLRALLEWRDEALDGASPQDWLKDAATPRALGIDCGVTPCNSPVEGPAKSSLTDGVKAAEVPVVGNQR
jgi:hypothetical protein